MKLQHKTLIMGILVCSLVYPNKYEKGSDYLKDTMTKYPSEYGSGHSAGKVSDWNPSHGHVYGPRKGKKHPGKLDNSLLFFTDFDMYLTHNSKFWSHVLYPFMFVWHASSILYMEWFAKKYENTDHYPGNPLSYLHYIEYEDRFRAYILWFFWPWIMLWYIVPFHKTWTWIFDD